MGDPYLISGTTVLRNLAGIENQPELDTFEANRTAFRLLELRRSSFQGQFDLAHLRAIHFHIFQDVYDWAGQLRTVRLSKGGSLFAFPAHIGAEIAKLGNRVVDEQGLRRSSAAHFAACGARYLADLNAIHPFREGNGRTQREWLRQLALTCGFHLDWARISRPEMTEASIVSFRSGDSTLLHELLVRITGPASAASLKAKRRALPKPQ